jgi:1-acyl-sn-glycerol-3-phosphate acyltransferase
MTLLRRLRGSVRLLRVLVLALHGLVVATLRFPAQSLAQRQAFVGWWSARMLQVMGIGLKVQGSLRPGAKLVVSNHVSWIDIVAIHAVCPEARFVSKSDVQHWPVLNRLAAAGRTMYIEREKRRDAMRVVHQMAQALQDGDTVAVFPEGTTGDGRTLLPFHANLLQAAIATGTPVQPVVLRFSDADHAVSPAALFLGETTLAQSLWTLLCAQGLVVQVQVLTAQGTAHADRRALAEYLRATIADALGA